MNVPQAPAMGTQRRRGRPPKEKSLLGQPDSPLHVGKGENEHPGEWIYWKGFGAKSVCL